MANECWNDQWLLFILGIWLYIPFIVAIFLPFCATDKRSDHCYKIGWIANIIAFLATTIIGIVIINLVADVVKEVRAAAPNIAPMSGNSTNVTHFSWT
ncbi:hypothetical protein KC19_9G016900 [Ceratodon purpureus]|uniref:Uncharacterized protein n=1 Tax=Ceratodon purpureus TaxID=3225 RepID=A0A8T0GP95_CERPU|nr:hypothetical protein KC19_9G016900 [Ceratodon purpureus]KAG0560831.1 hypothetical protein KC19_9G016900 [Ceratodon purpureus]